MSDSGVRPAAIAGAADGLRLGSNAFGARRQHGVRPVQSNMLIEELIVKAVGGNRLHVLRNLSESPMSVTSLANTLFLSVTVISRDLAILETCGLVICFREKNSRIYRLTERVKTSIRGAMVQIAISNGAGDWFLIHLDEGADAAQAVAPPLNFVERQSREPVVCEPRRTLVHR